MKERNERQLARSTAKSKESRVKFLSKREGGVRM